MRALIDKLPYSVLIVITAILLLAPLRPMPHVVEKLIMLKNGSLQRPIDIFDLCYHMAPLLVLLIKVRLDAGKKKNRYRQK
jgi:hypothetical protein